MKIIKLKSSDIKIQINKIRRRQEKDLNVIEKKVDTILREVRLRGDKSLFELSRKFDNFELTKKNIRIDQTQINNSSMLLSSDIKSSIKKSIKRVKNYQKKKLPKSHRYKDEFGNILGWNVNPINRIGIYVPGGTASYPSSLIMTATLAKVAGSKELVVSTPPGTQGINPAILFTADQLGIKEVLQVGGAQAIAALAYGTGSVKSVDKIVGPGNIFVATAKKQVFGKVDIDMIAGPSEVLIIADTNANPEYVAADLIAQAEHDVQASAICLTTSVKLAKLISTQIKKQSSLLKRRDIINASIKQNGTIFVLKNLDDCINFSNVFAPEHLEIFVKQSSQVENKILNAGSIFVGENSGEAFGDYIAGPSHVLPTAGSATFSSPLSALDFVKYSSYTKISKLGAKSLGQDVILLAKEEGLDGHANSIALRLEKGKKK
ncbi:MAG: histidinol dehydrogenase [Thermodesulfobacteriota bacteirum]|nr:histidinol dehydrogenase [Thermodesulfobacteriota bacterium]